MFEMMLGNKSIPPIPFDVLTQPLLAGTAADGWYGEVPTANLITGPALASAVGLTMGTPMPVNALVPWLHFTSAGKHLLVGKTCYRNNMMWNDMNSLGIVFGTRTIVIGPYTYKVRLIKGASSSEWDKLVYKVSENDPTATFWARYTDTQLGMSTILNDGAGTYCQDTHSTIYVFERGQSRVGSGTVVVRSRGVNKDLANGFIGWRPVLELVP